MSEEVLQRDIKHNKELIDGLDEDKQKQWQVLDDHAENINFLKGVFWVLVPIITGIIIYIIQDAIRS